MKIHKVFEVIRQNKPDLLFPDEPVSKQWTKVPSVFKAEQEARNRAIEDEDYKYRLRERVYRYIRKSGFTRDGVPVHNVEVRETISLREV